MMHPSFAGWYLDDELMPNEFSSFEPYNQWLHHYDPNHMIYTNHVQWQHGNNTEYLEQMNNFAELFHPVVWVYDSYPLRSHNGTTVFDNDGFYRSFQLYAEFSRQSGRPFWAFCQSCSYLEKTSSGSFGRTPGTEAFFRFEAFSALAYGAQGIIYWNYCVEPNYGDHLFYSSLVDRDGNKNRAWFAAQKVNEEIKFFSNIFLGATVKSLCHIGNNFVGKEYLLDTDPSAEIPFLDEIQGETFSEYNHGVLVSYLENNGKNYLLIVTHNPFESQKIKIRFNTGYSISVLAFRQIQSGKFIPSETTPGIYELSGILPPGGYMLFQIG